MQKVIKFFLLINKSYQVGFKTHKGKYAKVKCFGLLLKSFRYEKWVP